MIRPGDKVQEGYGKTYFLRLPVSVAVSKREVKGLNLNWYRNAHYSKANHQKKTFTSMVKPQVDLLPVFARVSLSYTLYVATMRLVDTNNIISITDKYFSDVLVEMGKIPDDNYKYTGKVTSEFGGVLEKGLEPFTAVKITSERPIEPIVRCNPIYDWYQPK